MEGWYNPFMEVVSASPWTMERIPPYYLQLQACAQRDFFCSSRQQSNKVKKSAPKKTAQTAGKKPGKTLLTKHGKASQKHPPRKKKKIQPLHRPWLPASPSAPGVSTQVKRKALSLRRGKARGFPGCSRLGATRTISLEKEDEDTKTQGFFR